MQYFARNKITASTNMLSQKSHDCKQSERREIILPETHQQYSRIECAVCGRWISWGRDPKVTEEHEARKKLIDKNLFLNLKLGFLSHWQQTFLQDVREKRFMTEKQKTIYESIVSIFKIN